MKLVSHALVAIGFSFLLSQATRADEFPARALKMTQSRLVEAVISGTDSNQILENSMSTVWFTGTKVYMQGAANIIFDVKTKILEMELPAPQSTIMYSHIDSFEVGMSLAFAQSWEKLQKAMQSEMKLPTDSNNPVNAMFRLISRLQEAANSSNSKTVSDGLKQYFETVDFGLKPTDDTMMINGFMTKKHTFETSFLGMNAWGEAWTSGDVPNECYELEKVEKVISKMSPSKAVWEYQKLDLPGYVIRFVEWGDLAGTQTRKTVEIQIIGFDSLIAAPIVLTEGIPRADFLATTRMALNALREKLNEKK